MSKQKPIVTIVEPQNGWSHLTIKDEEGKLFNGSLSYIQDIYPMFLRAFAIYLREGQQVAISIDEEGTGFTIVLTPYCLDIIEDRSNTPAITRLYIEDREFISQCLTAFNANFDKWIRFCYMADEDEANYETDVRIAKELIADINKYLDEKSKIWQNVNELLHKNEENPHE